MNTISPFITFGHGVATKLYRTSSYDHGFFTLAAFLEVHFSERKHKVSRTAASMFALFAETPLAHLTVDQLNARLPEFQVHLRSRKYKPGSVVAYMVALRRVVDKAVELGAASDTS